MRQSFLASVIAIIFGMGLSAAYLTRDRMFFVGLSLVIVGTAGVLHWWSARRMNEVNRPADDAYELGYQMGYDRGYTEGHREARPVVVPLQRGENHFSSTSMR